MAMTPTYEISPGKGIGVFRLGDTLWHVLELLRGSKTEYPKVEVSWDTECPQRSAVIIHLPQLTLYFPHSPNQRLTQLTIPNLTQSPTHSLVLTYETQILSSGTQPLTRAKVGKILGPTFGSAGGKLEYPGISFDLQSATGSVTGVGGREDLVRSLTVVPRTGEGIGGAGGREAILESCVIIPDVGVDLLFSHSSSPIQLRIRETTAQDLLLDLGPPLRKFWKEDDRLERMWGGGETSSTAAVTGQCFWNYFQYGLDVLVSSEDSHGDGGTILKIIVHSNIPGTPLFQRYARCPWTLPTSSGALDLTSTPKSFNAHLTGTNTNTLGSGYSGEDNQSQTINVNANNVDTHLAVPIPVTNGNGSSGKKKKSKHTGSGSTSPAVVGSFGDSDKDLVPKAKKGGSDVIDAMELDRVVEGGLDDVINIGPSRLIGYDGLIIEQDIACGGICSVLVWRDGQS